MDNDDLVEWVSEYLNEILIASALISYFVFDELSIGLALLLAGLALRRLNGKI